MCIAAALQQEDDNKGLSKRRKSFRVGNRNINLRKPSKAGKQTKKGRVTKNKKKNVRRNNRKNIANKKRTTGIRKTKMNARKKQGRKTKTRHSGRQQNSTSWEACFENSVTALRRYKGLFTY